MQSKNPLWPKKEKNCEPVRLFSKLRDESKRFQKLAKKPEPVGLSCFSAKFPDRFSGNQIGTSGFGPGSSSKNQDKKYHNSPAIETNENSHHGQKNIEQFIRPVNQPILVQQRRYYISWINGLHPVVINEQN